MSCGFPYCTKATVLPRGRICGGTRTAFNGAPRPGPGPTISCLERVALLAHLEKRALLTGLYYLRSNPLLLI